MASDAGGVGPWPRILLINPNTTASMTAAMVQSAQAVDPNAELIAATARHGVPAIDGHTDDVAGAAAAIELVGAHEGLFDGVIIGCFGDPGLFAARELTGAPVVGLAEASLLTAMTLGRSFSILTTTDRNAAKLEDVVRLHGVESRCASVRAAGVTVLGAHHAPDAAADALEHEGRHAIELDRADVLCLGCGGMVGLRERLERRLEVPVVEAVPAAMAVLCGLIRVGLRTSKARSFSTTLKETPR